MKRYDIEPEPMPTASEPAVAYARRNHVGRKRELPPDCMTVDEYFDGLMEEIRKEYARLRGDI